PMSARNREKATRLMLTAFSMSSMPSRMPIALRRVSTPKRPIANTRAPRIRYAWSGIASVVGAGEVDGAEEAGHQEHAQDLERHGERPDEGAPDRRGLVADATAGDDRC